MISREFNPGLSHPNYLTRKRLLQSVQRYSAKFKGILLDFGCGSKPYRSLFPVDEYIGLDYENPGHPHINEQIDVFYDGKNIPFNNEHFDAVFSSEVLEHVFNPDEIIKELNRVLKKDGTMLLTCPFAISEHEVPHDYARYSSFGVRHLLEKNGFEIISQEKSGNSIETIFQLWGMYLHLHVLPVFRKIPVVRQAARVFTFGLINVSALVFSKLLPNRQDLYLNNIVYARKTRSLV